MWKFSNLNSGYRHWPPDAGQQQLNPDSLVFPTHNSTIGCSDYISPLNSQVFKPANDYSRLNAFTITPTKRFLVFDHSVDHKSLKFSSVAAQFQALHPTALSSNASQAFASNSHGSDKQEEMHEDTEEIDALLYSDSEFSFDSEEASTGHSPLNMNVEEIISSPNPAKRRKLDLNDSAIDESLIDTASTARDESSKQDNIQAIVKLLRRIIPGGDAMDAAAVLDEAILYLKSLKLQANSLDATTASI